MKFPIPSKGYHLGEEGIAKTQTIYNAKYMGPWAIKDRRGHWAEMPVDVFYQPNPDVEQGHKDYFGIFFSHREGSFMICDATSAFEEPISGIECEDGTVIVSRYRHNFVQHGEVFIDGGRDYVRCGGATLPSKDQWVKITVDGGDFVLSK